VHFAGTPDFFQWPLSAPVPELPSSSSISAGVDWWFRLGSTLRSTDLVVLPPGPRNKSHDFVAMNLSMQPSHITHVQEQWRSFSASAEAVDSPVDTFKGRGIAILSGAAPYLVPSLIALKSLRATGCALPVEMWLPEAEAPPPEDLAGLQQDMARLGAKLILLPIPAALAGQVRVIPAALIHSKLICLWRTVFQSAYVLWSREVHVCYPMSLLIEEAPSAGAFQCAKYSSWV
jgi:hypothetical protein